MSVINNNEKGKHGIIVTTINSPNNQSDKPVSFYAGNGSCYAFDDTPCPINYYKITSANDPIVPACTRSWNRDGTLIMCQVSARDALTTWQDTVPLLPIIPALTNAEWISNHHQSANSVGPSGIIVQGLIKCTWDLGALFTNDAVLIFK